jgi:hypothetical protein
MNAYLQQYSLRYPILPTLDHFQVPLPHLPTVVCIAGGFVVELPLLSLTL